MNILAYLRGLPANEPALVGSAIVAVGAVASSLYPQITAAEVASVAATTSLVVGIAQRFAVTPLAKLPGLIAAAISGQGAKQ